MQRVLWKEIAPQVDNSILREDGRVCLLESVDQELYADEKKKIPLPVPRIRYRMRCKDVLYALEISLNVYHPAATPEAPTCLDCIAKTKGAR